MGADVLSITLRGDVFDLTQLNRDTELGEPEREDSEGLGFLNVTGLTVGVHDLGQILPSDSRITTSSRFALRFDEVSVQTVVLGVAEKQPSFQVIPPANPTDSSGIGGFEGSLADFPTAADRTADFYYDAQTGSVIVSIGAEVLIFSLEGFPA